MDIRQLSVSYQLDQDRILVRVNTSVNEEVLMWLTRHMMLRLWPMINRVVIDHLAIPADAKTDGYVDLNAIGPGTRKMLADMRRQEAVEKADFSTPYQGEVAARPLGETPLLVTEVNLTPKTNGQLQMNFKELLREPASNRGFQLDMPADLVFGVIQLLHQALQQSQWQLASPVSTVVATVVDVTDEVDLSPDATRPTYLN
jgi:hypothetical protein